MRIYFLITIDTECDKGGGWLIQRPMKFESVLTGIPKLFSPLFSEFDLKPTYLLSPEVMYNEECVAVLKSQKCAELGTHLHGEFIPPEPVWHTNRTKTPQLLYSKKIEEAKLRNLTQLFKDQFTYQPTSFRAGRWGMSMNTLSILEKLGYWVDSSVCPFRTHIFSKKSAINFWGSPLQPYHPAESDFRRKGQMKIIEMPVTLWNPILARFPKFFTRMFTDRTKVYKKILHKLGFSSKITWLRPYRSSAKEMISLSDEMVSYYRKKREHIFLNMMFHSNEIIPGASPYVQSAKEQAAFVDSMRMLFDHLKIKYELVGIGLSEVKKVVQSI